LAIRARLHLPARQRLRRGVAGRAHLADLQRRHGRLQRRPAGRLRLRRDPQVSALKGVTLLDTNSLTHFAADLQSPYTCQYTFIEPNYGDITSSYRGGSSQHPMDDVYGGEGLIKAVYEAIRNSPVWDTSLLIITYDEHGRFYDSVPPPAATPPNDDSPSTHNQWGFTFAQLGVRVPAVVVSPWIAPHTVDHTVYDHSSVPATIGRLFGRPPLTARDAAANDVTPVFTEPHPRTNAPTKLNDPAPPTLHAAIDPQAAQARLTEPIPESGSLPGFLQILLKTDLELSTTPQERDEALARHVAVATRADARSYINYVMAKAQAAKTGSPAQRPKSQTRKSIISNGPCPPPLTVSTLSHQGRPDSPGILTAISEPLRPGAGLVTGFLNTEGVFEVDIAPVDDRHEQDEGVNRFVANVGRPATGVLRISLKLADGAVEFADFLTELETLGGEVLVIQASLGFHPPDVVLDVGQRRAQIQWMHIVTLRAQVDRLGE
jgi:hypothetical protein